MHADVYAFVTTALRALPPRVRVLEIGSRNINGSVRGLCPDAEWYCGIDLQAGADVDVVADGASFRTAVAPDTVICCEVLEHADQAEAIVANIYDQLAPGGVAILTMATEGRAPHSAVHGGGLQPGEFYRNVRCEDLLRWCRGFSSIKVAHHPERGDLYAVAVK